MTTEERSVSKREYKAMLCALKIIPMLLALCSMLNMLFDFFGIDSRFFSFVSGMSLLPLVFLYIASYVFQFCAYHRMFLHYIVANNALMAVDYYIGIPVSNAVLFMLYLLLIGMFLFLVLYYHQKEKCCRR
jgi:hypothetical protein